jgi:hypothetical protein
MTDKKPAPNTSNPDVEAFARQAAEGTQSVLGEFLYFLRTNKKWWLTPIIIVLLGVSLLVLVGGTAAAPFIYTLF